MRNLRLGVCVLALVALAGGTTFAQGQAPANRPALDDVLRSDGQPDDLLRVIVKHRPGASARLKNRVRPRVDAIANELRGIGALTVALRRANLHAVCGDPDVLGCSIDAPLRPTAEPERKDYFLRSGKLIALPSQAAAPAPEYDAQKLQATLGVTSSFKGTGVGVAVIDSGIAPSADLNGRITAFYDFTQGGIATAPYDEYGHGTHVAGLVAGNGALSAGQYVGVATRAHLIGLKVLDALGQGYSSDVIAALDFAVTNRAALGIDVINMSLGHPIFEPAATDPLVQAVERAVAAGIVVVVSAGNIGLLDPTTGEVGYGGITSPGNAPSALTVGAMRTKATADRSDDEIALFSSRGPTWYDGRVKPDVVAPGQGLVAINATSTTMYQKPELQAEIAPYLRLSGTSMAAGVASGVVALVIEANRLDEGASSVLTPNTVKAILQFTALPVPYTFTDGIPSALAEGAGGLNAAGATALAQAIDPAMPAGEPWLDAAVSPFSTIAGVTHAWGQHIVWGNRIVWGDIVFRNHPAWAQGIVWGDYDEDGVVWGDNDDGVVWGDYDDGVVWGDNVTSSANLVRQSFYLWSAHIVWGDGYVSGTYDDGVVWGDYDDDGVVWGDSTDRFVWGESVR
ncbi:MAG: S8 family serine peptidase [Acidobacteria bacterium]|nr:S8 family serine peptidase [Acidobacteriota bacterium]